MTDGLEDHVAKLVLRIRELEDDVDGLVTRVSALERAVPLIRPKKSPPPRLR